MRLIDANAIIREECGSCDGHCNTFDGEECLKCTSHNKCQLREALDSAHTVDAVEVVRCVDCERGEPSLIRKGEILCDWWRCHTRCDGFCHMGVEKDETD